MPYSDQMHIKYDREAKAFECDCGYLQGERDNAKAAAHEREYHRIAKAMTWGMTHGRAATGIWPTQLSEEAKPGDIATWNPEDGSVVFHKPTYGGPPVVFDNAVPKGNAYLVTKNDFDNAGRHISDIAKEVKQISAYKKLANPYDIAGFFDHMSHVEVAEEARKYYAKTKRKWYYLWLK